MGPTGPQPSDHKGIAGAGVDWKGTWDSGVEYFTDDGVSFNGTSYISKQDNNTNHLPTDVSWWDVWVAKGEVGATGPQGVEGPTGPTGAEGAI